MRTVVWLVLDQLDQLCLGGSHDAILLLLRSLFVSRASPSLPNTGDKLQGSDMLGLVSFIPLFDTVARSTE